nr:bifunctional diguanylate cyclase/phosphodiesterase [uncultured Holophaga sp.]
MPKPLDEIHEAAPAAGALDAAGLLDQLAQARAEVHLLRGELSSMRQQDPITGLPNRFRLQDRLEQATQLATRGSHFAALLYITIDRFETMAQTLGFREMDELIRQIAKRVEAILHLGDTLASLGGDRFVILLPTVQDPFEPSRVAQAVLDAIRIPFRVGSRHFHFTSSIGISLFPQDGGDVATLFQHAESAARRASTEGGNRIQCTTATLSEAFLERRELETYLGEAIATGALGLNFQPLAGPDGSLIGMEALLRWDHPLLGAVPPSKIIPLAEENRLIHPLGEWVLRKACREAVAWQALSPKPVRLAVNVSAFQMGHPQWVDLVAKVLRETRLPAFCLELELTESSLLKQGRPGAGPLHELKRLGVRISIDDFGTGYSCLSYLQRLPIDTLKIDRSFVAGLHPETPEDTALPIIQTILNLGANLGLEVIAEGVETDIQRKTLEGLGCRTFQGYLLGRPMDPEAVRNLLEDSQIVAFNELFRTDQR